ncbi:hypothetical protein COB11_05215 [Candidatus Aerophobetes bacterium]|uniref:SDR family NAD(P)-dependent oxidoreductase n=1 Tax=Aerophobetes bacterium TaxID=2030807 RepID=A0A2A4YFJ9_UNCAE|nr:MAG: hypothetical protein COB11_05215 [Candidatus Aerophobetes bacterium]
MKTVVIVGGNRGIGLEFAKEYLKKDNNVVATYRDKTKLVALKKLQKKYPGKLTLRKLDVTNMNDIAKLRRGVKKVDLLILSAGVKGYPIPGTRPAGNTRLELQKALAVNTTGPDDIIRGFYKKLLHSDRCVVYLSSGVSSTQDNAGGGYHPYRISKAAGNAMIWNWNIEFQKDWIQRNGKDHEKVPCAFAICPGWVKTDMGGADARQSVEESVTAMSKVIDTVGKTKDAAGLYMYDGTKLETYKSESVLQVVGL